MFELTVQKVRKLMLSWLAPPYSRPTLSPSKSLQCRDLGQASLERRSRPPQKRTITPMNTPAAIIIAGALIAAAILVTNHWQVATGPGPWILDRWTGHVSRPFAPD
jgi:hypothetical protein